MGQKVREQESKKNIKVETIAPLAFFFAIELVIISTPTHAPLVGVWWDR